MIFAWLRRRRRAALTADPMPAAWRATLERHMAVWSRLSAADQAHLEKLVQVFVAETDWRGAGGQVIDDEVRVTIAGQACLLLLGLEHDCYSNVETVVVYPSTVMAPPSQASVFAAPGQIHKPTVPVLGLAHHRGPVVLAWDAVRSSGSRLNGHNLVIHEFAHKIDLTDGAADGTPRLHHRADYPRWVEVCSREFLALRARRNTGRSSLLDAYGATNEAEFFAVASEVFFDRPVELKRRHGDLYEVLSAFYRQDPASWG